MGRVQEVQRLGPKITRWRGDEEEREKGWSAVEEYGQGMMEAGNAASTCSEEQVYAGRSVKTRS